MIRTRQRVRLEYNIAKDNVCEDFSLSVFCTPCTLSQMGQHTADYSTYVGFCLSDTGLSRHVECKLPHEIVDVEGYV